jgi:hypothetical protein
MSDILTIQFSGRVLLKRRFEEDSVDSKESENDFIQRNKIVRWLDRHSDFIADDIRREIKKVLPPGVQVNANIDFNYGSIEWAGVVIILDWMARLGSSAGLVEYIVKGVKIAVDKVVRRNIRNRTTYCETVSTEAVATPSQNQAGQVGTVSPPAKNTATSNNWQLILVVVNVVLSLGILCVLLWGK